MANLKLLHKIIEGLTLLNFSIFFFSEILDLQLRLKDSLNMTWKNSLSHDWIPVEKAKTFPLREFYVGLRWVRVVKRAIRNFKEELKSFYDILEIVGLKRKTKGHKHPCYR